MSSILPKPRKADDFSGEFAALVKVIESRYAKRQLLDKEGNPIEGYAATIGVQWTMLSTRGNTFSRIWSTGLPWGGEIAPSSDSKTLVGPFNGFKESSDGNFFMEKIVSSGYPTKNISSTDVSCFDNAVFYLTTDKNTRSSGSGKKPYPKEYHAEGWEAALQARADRQTARDSQNAAQSTPTTAVGVYAVPAVVVAPDVTKAASEALQKILEGSKGQVSRKDILTGLNKLEESKGWKPSFRQNVTQTLFEISTLKSIVAQNPKWRLEADTVYING